jgi:beta-xylosidase
MIISNTDLSLYNSTDSPLYPYDSTDLDVLHHGDDNKKKLDTQQIDLQLKDENVVYLHKSINYAPNSKSGWFKWTEEVRELIRFYILPFGNNFTLQFFFYILENKLHIALDADLRNRFFYAYQCRNFYVLMESISTILGISWNYKFGEKKIRLDNCQNSVL